MKTFLKNVVDRGIRDRHLYLLNRTDTPHICIIRYANDSAL